MTVAELIDYLLGRDATHDLAVQLAYVQATRTRAGRTRTARTAT